MFTSFVENVVFPLAQTYMGNGFVDQYKALMRSQWLPPKELQQLQWHRLKAILNHAYKNVPMYQRRFQEAGVTPDDIRSREDMLKLFIITKEDMRAGFPQEVTARNISPRAFVYNSTSGSTGNPFTFIMDKRLVAAKIALHFRNLGWAGILPGTKHIKLWGSHDEEMGKRIFTRYCMRRLELSCFELDDRRYQYYETIRKYKPVAIEAYTSAMVKLARMMIDDGVSDLHVPSAIVSAETLTENNRKLIEETLHCKVFNRYGSREFGNVAQECDVHTGLHINCENFFIEVVSDGRHASPGELGKLIITCFDNYAMPFIRYDTGDMGTALTSHCSCGRGLPLLGSIDGRVTEFLVMPSGKLVPYLLFNYLFEQYGAYVTQFQIKQETRDAIHVKLVPVPSYTPEVEEQLVASFHRHLGDEMSVTIEKVDEIPLTPSGKQITIESKVFE